MKYYGRSRLLRFCTSFLQAKGVPPASAGIVSEVVVDTEALGVHTHGLLLLGYFDKVIPGDLNPEAEPRVEKERVCSALINGNAGFSQLAMKLAKEIAEDKARRCGVAMVAVRNCSWMGALGVYLVSLARKGFLAQLWAQTSSEMQCAPFGGIDAAFSTNPIALAFPTAGDPMVSDFSTAIISFGKTRRMAANGEKADDVLYLDKDGNYSNDPKVFADGGSILLLGGPRRGYKGFALSLWCEALTAVAGGRCADPDSETRQTINMILIDPEAFAGSSYYHSEMGSFLERIKRSRLLPGVEEIRLPGKRSFDSLRRCESQGIEVEDALVARLNHLAEKHGIPRLE